MGKNRFNHVKVTALKTVVPEQYVDIEDELQYFDNNPKKLARAKKMAGFGRRYLCDENSTVVDMCVDAAEKLICENHIDKSAIELLIVVNEKPDYLEPSDACVIHGRLGLETSCTVLDLPFGCPGYPHGLLVAHSMIASGAVKNCLLLAGSMVSPVDLDNRKLAPIFGDAASATWLEYTEEQRDAWFVTGTRGRDWDKIIVPFGGHRLPIQEDVMNLREKDALGNSWDVHQKIINGPDVFNFSIDIGPKMIQELLEYSEKNINDVDYYAIHQANKQIVENIIARSGIPMEKSTTEVFTKYANNSTNSVVTVICDQLVDRPVRLVMLCTFGIGLQWGGCLLDLSDVKNGGIASYTPPKHQMNRSEQIQYWINQVKGE